MKMFTLTTAQQKLRGIARELAQEAAAQAAETDRSQQYPWPMVARMTEARPSALNAAKAEGLGDTIFTSPA